MDTSNIKTLGRYILIELKWHRECKVQNVNYYHSNIPQHILVGFFQGHGGTMNMDLLAPLNLKAMVKIPFKSRPPTKPTLKPFNPLLLFEKLISIHNHFFIEHATPHHTSLPHYWALCYFYFYFIFQALGTHSIYCIICLIGQFWS